MDFDTNCPRCGSIPANEVEWECGTYKDMNGPNTSELCKEREKQNMNRWQIVTDEAHPFKEVKWVRCIAHIRKNSTNEVRSKEHDMILEDGMDYPSVYNWEENNYSCDCNRELFFENAAPGEIDDHCSEGRFSVNIENPTTGEIFYREFK